MKAAYDAVVVGAGPNGLVAAIVLAQAGRSVLVVEAEETVGGAARTMELTLLGFRHDPFSAVYPLSTGSPFIPTLPLGEHGLEWIHPPVLAAHPLDGGRVALLERSFAGTGASLGVDADAWRRVMQPYADRWTDLAPDILGPLGIPRHPFLLARFGLAALRTAQGLAEGAFRQEEARALFAGIAAHCALPLTAPATASFGLVLAAAGHASGWPIPRGGAGSLTGALASYLRSLGGEIVTGTHVASLDELPPSRAVLLDLTAHQVVEVAGSRLPDAYRRRMGRFRYGPGVFKVDWALSEPVPWTAEGCRRAGTVHLGGTLREVAASEAAAAHGRHAEHPFVLFAQPSLFDGTRAPQGKHVGWAYCHVPNGSTQDMTERIEAQVERFAPGFRDTILARHTMNTSQIHARDANLVGGDINGGSPDLAQLFFRPVTRRVPYATPVKGLYLCSASTPPGGGVHGMCGYHAARAALTDGF
ncbi:MAG TPA: NAD(P)/FAD-dependent oxidoreductase [Longimicrobiaceae bacterium]|jgi:phytoene dehydrogenase-like protein|nr:NAD(P)/FAD-dependent oxidoreductase [Longimicrobiaceae bacterium]